MVLVLGGLVDHLLGRNMNLREDTVQTERTFLSLVNYPVTLLYVHKFIKLTIP